MVACETCVKDNMFMVAGEITVAGKTDDCDELVPEMLNFVRGAADSEDFSVYIPRDSAAEHDFSCHQENSCQEMPRDDKWRRHSIERKRKQAAAAHTRSKAGSTEERVRGETKGRAGQRRKRGR